MAHSMVVAVVVLDAGSVNMKLLIVTLSVPRIHHIKSKLPLKPTVVVYVRLPTGAVMILPAPSKVRVLPVIVLLSAALPRLNPSVGAV